MIRDVLHIGYNVRREEHNTPLSDLADQLPEAHTLHWIQSCSRFIQDQHLRPVQQSLRYSEALFHTSGICAHSLLGHIGQTDRFKKFLASDLGFVPGDPFQCGHIEKEISSREFRVAAKLLRQISQNAPIALLRHRYSVISDLSTGRCENTANHAH